MTNDGSSDVPARKPYTKPRLVVHGDFQTLTGVKGGTAGDGGGKPNTRVKGKPV